MQRYLAGLKNTLRRPIDRLKYRARARRLEAEGYRVVNPFFKDYQLMNGRELRDGLAEILEPATQGRKLDVILEQGCDTGRRVTPQLKQFANEVWGVDLFPADKVVNCARYIQADPTLADGHLAAFPDASVDLVLVLNYIGLHPHSMWPAYVDQSNDRLAPYLRASNFPRVLKANGHLVIAEWEAQPEKRVGKRTAADVHHQAATLYGAPAIPGFALIVSGFAARLRSPYLVYRRA